MRLLIVVCALMGVIGCVKEDGGGDSPAPAPEQEVTVIQGEQGLQYYTGLIKSDDPEKEHMGGQFVSLLDCDNLPEAFDLRELGLVPSVKDQGSCGSCWSFSKTGSLESALLGQGIDLDLSEQEMVSCDKQQYGCRGGMLKDFSYQIKKGQTTEDAYPYTSGRNGVTGSCKSNTTVAGKGVSFQYIGSPSRSPTEKELMCALVKYKTIPWITVGATNAWGNPPKSEKTPYTSCGRSQTNHAVGVVGYWKDSRGKTQFIMKNSWGKNWGDKGYMSLPLGCNNFGEEVAFIEVEQLLPPPPPGPGPVPPPPPTPGPCIPPKVAQAAEVQVFKDTEIMIGVKAEKDVTYSWTVDGKEVGTEPTLYVTPEKDAVYKLTGKNACAVSESQVRVRLVMSAQRR